MIDFLAAAVVVALVCLVFLFVCSGFFLLSSYLSLAFSLARRGRA